MAHGRTSVLLHYNLHNLYQIFALIIAKKKNFPEKKGKEKETDNSGDLWMLFVICINSYLGTVQQLILKNA